MKTTTILFDFQIKEYEAQALRGIVLDALRPDVPLVFHNHTQDGLRFSYPLVQYKAIGGKAAVVLIEEGAEYAGKILQATAGRAAHISGRTVMLNISGFREESVDVAVTDEGFCYTVAKWCPLNSGNYTIFKSLESDEEKRIFLSRVFVGNVLSLCKGTDIFLERQILCEIKDIKNIRPAPYKGVDLMTMDVDLITNVRLPLNIGLGKHASIGFGILAPSVLSSR